MQPPARVISLRKLPANARPPRSERQTLEQRIGDQSIRAMEPRAARLPDRIQRAQRRSPELIRLNPSDHVMRRRMNRDEIPGNVDVEFIHQPRKLREPLPEC